MLVWQLFGWSNALFIFHVVILNQSSGRCQYISLIVSLIIDSNEHLMSSVIFAICLSSFVYCLASRYCTGSDGPTTYASRRYIQAQMQMSQRSHHRLNTWIFIYTKITGTSLIVLRAGTVLGSITYLPVAAHSSDRVQIYPKFSNAPLTVVISKQDLMTFLRNRNESWTNIRVEIDLAKVYRTAERAVQTKEMEALDLPWSLPGSDQLAPSSPPGGMANASDASTK